MHLGLIFGILVRERGWLASLILRGNRGRPGAGIEQGHLTKGKARATGKDLPGRVQMGSAVRHTCFGASEGNFRWLWGVLAAISWV